MGRFDTTKTFIDANIKTNGNQEITGQVLNNVLKQVVDDADASITELSNKLNGVDVVWQSINSRTWYVDLDLAEINGDVSISWSDNEYIVKTKGLNADGSESGYGADPWYWLEGCPQTGLVEKNKVDGVVVVNKDAVLASHPSTTRLQVIVRVGSSHVSITPADCNETFDIASSKLIDERSLSPELRDKINGKVNASDLATINGMPLNQGGNIVISGPGQETEDLEVEWLSINSRTWYFYVDLADLDTLTISWTDNAYTLKAKGLNADGSESGYGADPWYWLEGCPQTGLVEKNKVDGSVVVMKSEILANYPSTTKLQVVVRVDSSHNSITPQDCNETFDIVASTSSEEGTLETDKVVVVGEGGDFPTINAAMQYLSRFYPKYKYGGINALIRIKRGTIINEQILVVGADYSWMTITYEGYDPDSKVYGNVAESIANGTIEFDTTEGYESVSVNASSWTNAGITHDTRGNVCLFRAEDGGRLPKIKCVFKLETQGNYPVAGIVCNRGSSCVVSTLCGFIGFHDGVIANNESSITIREGITMNCERWGCHARHNGEVSARSVIATGCAFEPESADVYAALCADRIADLDGREAWVSAGTTAFRVANASRINCNGTHILGPDTAVISATSMALGNFVSLYCECPIKLKYDTGSMLTIGDYIMAEEYSFNTISNKGIIFKG